MRKIRRDYSDKKRKMQFVRFYKKKVLNKYSSDDILVNIKLSVERL